jgi:A/G-specific adenine glycosylase
VRGILAAMVRPHPTKVRRVQRGLVAWFQRHQRDLPWRGIRDPYAILVSEIMLQQTQVDRVIPKYWAWLERFPDVRRLARATPRDVLLAWEGMGYNRRALYLHRAARIVTEQHGGMVPSDSETLRTLPGVGPYTAAAVATFSTGVPHALADTNVERVIGRIFLGMSGLRARVLPMMEATMPRRSVLGVPASHWGHVLMDFGALVCKAKPRCDVCPVRKICKAYPDVLEVRNTKYGIRSSRVLSSRRPLPDRIYRGRILQLLREHDPKSVPMRTIGPSVYPGFARRDERWLRDLIRRLGKEQLVEIQGREATVRLPS